MPRLVQHHAAIAWQDQHQRDAPAFILGLTLDDDAFGAQIRGGRD